jgi:hypothetical protein
MPESDGDGAEKSLNGARKAETAKLGTVMDEQIAVAEQGRLRGQNVRHEVPSLKYPSRSRWIARAKFRR